MKNGQTPTHVMRWCPQDYFASPLRGELAIERDHLTRFVYLELLSKLHESGGSLPRAEVPGALLITAEEAQKAIDRLLKSGRIVEKEGLLFNGRVSADLQRTEEFRALQSERGKKGGRPPGSGGNPSKTAGKATAKRALQSGNPKKAMPLPLPLPLPMPITDNNPPNPPSTEGGDSGADLLEEATTGNGAGPSNGNGREHDVRRIGEAVRRHFEIREPLSKEVVRQIRIALKTTSADELVMQLLGRPRNDGPPAWLHPPRAKL